MNKTYDIARRIGIGPNAKNHLVVPGSKKPLCMVYDVEPTGGSIVADERDFYDQAGKIDREESEAKFCRYCMAHANSAVYLENKKSEKRKTDHNT